ncbi:hypothetical protein LCGC14_2628670, partial [marine sediment metagenome]
LNLWVIYAIKSLNTRVAALDDRLWELVKERE